MSTQQGSTRNISHICNKVPRRVAIPFRPWTKAQCLLRKHKISQRDIAAESGVDLSSVNRSLSIRHFKRTNFASVLRVRDACGSLLIQHRAEINHATLWNDYDQAIFENEA